MTDAGDRGLLSEDGDSELVTVEWTLLQLTLPSLPLPTHSSLWAPPAAERFPTLVGSEQTVEPSALVLSQN